MKKFTLKVFLFFLVAELISRIFIDPFYFYDINTFNVKQRKVSLSTVINSDNTKHVDYLFIGSSRVAAAIDPAVITSRDSEKVVVVAGRGYSTPGITYQALVNKLSQFPDYLRDAYVFLEYAGSSIYAESFAEEKWRVYEPIVPSESAMPHLLLPYINAKDLFTFLKESKNSFPVKADLFLLYFISCYRTASYIREKIPQKILNQKLIFQKSNAQMDEVGGVRNDNIEQARQLAVKIASIESIKNERRPLLNYAILNQSSLSAINELVKESGGRLILYKMPMSSILARIYQTKKENENRRIFNEWLVSKNIDLIKLEKFQFNDDDFPDSWHLSSQRKADFTKLFLDEFNNEREMFQESK